MESMYAPTQTSLRPDWATRARFEELVRTLDNSSSPGWPYMREAPTIGKWLGVSPDGTPDPVQVERLWYDVGQVLAGQYEHIFRVFIKDEPHKISKIEAGKYRLIVASSLPMQMVWKMCLEEQNDELNKPYRTPSAHGLAFCYGGWRRFMAACSTRGIKYSRDISAWDVNAPGWVFDVTKEVRKRLFRVVDNTWLRTMDMLYEDAFADSKLMFSAGVVVQQQFRGFMKSGLLVTISDNSLAMVAMHTLACLRSGMRIGAIMATGDDVVQSLVSDDYLQRLEESGCRVKEVLHKLEFMGTDFTSGKPEPLYFSKHVVTLPLKREVLEQTLDAYARLYVHSDKYRFWQAVAARLGVTLRSQHYYRFWYDSPLAKALSFLGY